MTSTADHNSTAEAEVLAALGGGHSRTLGELADETALLPAAVRAILRELCRRGVVWRPGSGRWRLTELDEAEP